MKSRILLFGGGLQSLTLSRGLKDYKNYVFNIADKDAVGKYARYIDKFFVIKLKGYQATDFIHFINEYHIELVIPTEDEYAEWLSINKTLIHSLTSVKLAVADKELFQNVINKEYLLTFCERNNIPHPQTKKLNLKTISELKNVIKFPILIKPNISNGSRGICKVHSYDELVSKASEIVSSFGNCTIQEFIKNDHYYNVMLYRYDDGSWGPEVATKITRFYPINGGSSSFCTTIDNNKLIQLCKNLLEKLNWVGFADFDVLEKDMEDFRIIEINPRVPASLHAAYVSGINFGQIIVQDMLFDEKLEMEYKPGQQLRCLGLDIAWFLTSPNRFKSTPSWFKFWGKKVYYQEGGFKDFKAMIHSILYGIKKQLSPSFRKSKAGMN